MFRWLVLIIIVGMAGCNQTNQELVKDYHNDGMQLFKMGRYSDAQESFQAAQQLQPADPGIYYNLGQTYDYLKLPYDAEKCYKECIVRSPNHAGARHALTVLLMNQNRQDEAVKGIEDWLAKNPNCAAAYAEDGWIWKTAGDMPRAQSRYQQALSLDPSDTRTLVELAFVYEKLNRPDRSLVLYQRALEINPHQLAVKKDLERLRSSGTSLPHPD